MFKKYIVERLSWILLFVFMQLLILFVGFVDASIPFSSLIYVVFLSILVFAGFLAWRYPRETRFYRSLEAWDLDIGLGSLAEAESPLEHMVEEAVTLQNEKFTGEMSRHLIGVEQEKDDLLSWIHEVKTPMTTMRLMIDRLGDERLKRELKVEWLRIHLLLDQQLHQRRIPSMENDLYIESCQLEPVVNQEIRELQSWCMQKGIGFDVDLPVGEVLSDAKWLGFILRQVLSNAVKYSDSSDVSVTSRVDGQQRVVLEIRDQGRGIDPKDLPRVFDKGFTSTTDHQNQAASGMGLYLAQKAADSLHMITRLHSKPGEGTTVSLTFPKKNDMVELAGM